MERSCSRSSKEIGPRIKVGDELTNELGRSLQF